MTPGTLPQEKSSTNLNKINLDIHINKKSVKILDVYKMCLSIVILHISKANCLYIFSYMLLNCKVTQYYKKYVPRECEAFIEHQLTFV